MENIHTIPQMLESSCSEHAHLTALQMKDETGSYRKYTYKEFLDSVKKVSAFLVKNGIRKNDKVSLLSENRPEWPISHFGISSIGGVVVPFDPKLEDEELFNLIDNSDSQIVIVSDPLSEKIENIRSRLGKIRLVVNIDKDFPLILSDRDLDRYAAEVTALEENVGPDDLLEIIYTSGTTGKPKGVMLSHDNILSNVREVDPIFWMIGPGDNFLSVLPNYHTFEGIAMFVAISKGSTTTYAESLKSYNLLANMTETRVSILCAVPLLYRLFYDGIMRQIEEKGLAAKVLFSALFGLSKLSKMTRMNLGRTLFKMVHKKFGGNIKLLVSGGAALDPHTIKAFDLMGFTIIQGYGLTETAPILSACTVENNVFGSVGQALPGVDIKIDDANDEGIGEIVARGPNIMKGYYKNDEATAEVIKDGWFHTGDLGSFDKHGNLYITGRCKDVIVLGSGVNVYPDEVEFTLSKSPFISEICVFGGNVKEGALSGMEEVRAAAVPNTEYFDAWAKNDKLELNDSLVHAVIGGEIDKLGKHLTAYKRIAKYIISKEPLPKTPTRKIRRFVVKQMYNND